MSYKNRLGITQIKKNKIHNLSINWDADVKDVENCHKSKCYPVMLFTPNMNNTNNHYHIKLNRKETRKLRDWLNIFLLESKKRVVK